MVDPYQMGSRLELFVDRFLIDRMEGLERRMHPPRPAEKVLVFDRPWEGSTSAYVTVFRDGGHYRLYYRGSPYGGQPPVTCTAEGHDGIHWTRPQLGLVNLQGSSENNVVWAAAESHNFAPFLDTRPDAPDEERYKALAGEPPCALASADGLRWRKLQESPVLTQGAFDSQNVAFWDSARGCYAAYFRIYRGGGRAGQRSIARSTSADFLRWSDPEPLELDAAPEEHLYTSAVMPYCRAPHLLLAFPNRFLPDRQVVDENPLPGLSDTVMMVSRDGVRFDRSFKEAFIRPGRDRRNWTDRTNMVAWGHLQTAADELSLYVSRHFRQPTAHLQRCTIRVDGFASVQAPYRGGELVTRPLVIGGRCLVINYSTSAAGSVRVEIQDAAGSPLSGFTLEECAAMMGDEIGAIVRWRTGHDLGTIAGRPVRLRFALWDADLYSLRFDPGEGS